MTLLGFGAVKADCDLTYVPFGSTGVAIAMGVLDGLDFSAPWVTSLWDADDPLAYWDGSMEEALEDNVWWHADNRLEGLLSELDLIDDDEVKDLVEEMRQGVDYELSSDDVLNMVDDPDFEPYPGYKQACENAREAQSRLMDLVADTLLSPDSNGRTLQSEICDVLWRVGAERLGLDLDEL